MKNQNIITTTGQNIKNFIPAEQIKTITENAVYFILSVFISKGVAFGMYVPFGTAFLAAVPYKNMVFSLIGTIVGYILPSEVNIGIRYISTAISIFAIRWTLNDLSKIVQNKLYAPIISFATTIATGLAINIYNITDLNRVVMYLAEALISGFSSYFFCKSIYFFYQKKTKIKQAELVYLCLTVFILILSLMSVTIGYVSLGKVLAILVIIFCARYLGVVGGSIAGISAGVIFGLTFKEPSYVMGAYSFGGLMAGFVSNFGRVPCCLSFLVASIIISIQTGDTSVIISGIYEVLIASIVFIFLRDDIGDKFSCLFSSQISQERQDGIKNTVIMRLDFVSKALSNISESISFVSEKLSQIGQNKQKDACLASIDKVCSGCGLKTFCFDEKNVDTSNTFSQINKILNHSGKINKDNFPTSFISRCGRITELTNTINDFYKEFSEKKISEKRALEVRNFISEQFSEVSLLLTDIVTEIKNYDFFDIDLSKKIKLELKKLSITPTNVCCRYDKLGRLSIEIEIIDVEKDNLDKINLSKFLSKISLKKLDLPHINHDKEICRIQLTEKPNFKLQVGVAQHVCKNGTLCGDNYIQFNDGMGRIIFILSDGMGTGGRAAVEGAMACKIMENLIKSGMNFKTAAKITNSILLIKSEDEFLATLDIFCVDLFSGNLNIFKAGAPLTLLNKNNKIIRCEQSSLPIGILKEINVAEYNDIITNGDKVLMVSDGAISHGDTWLNDIFENWKEEDSQSFADSVINKILHDKNKDFDDDITVVAMKLSEC